jgi:hypothetical protein
MIGTLVGVLGVTFAGVLSSDTLCPDHRAWVQILGTIGFTMIVVALVGLVRGWAVAPALTVVAGALGVAIGLIDAVHSPTRGRLIALGFAVAMAVAGLATARAVQLARWDRRAVAGGEPAERSTAVEVAPPTDSERVETVDEPPGIRATR